MPIGEPTPQGRFGMRLRAARMKRGLTLADVGRFVGKKAQTIHRYEAAWSAPPLEMIDTLARLYGVTVAWLVDPANAKPLRAA